MRHFAQACFVPLPQQTCSSGSHVGPRPRNVHRPQMIPIWILHWAPGLLAFTSETEIGPWGRGGHSALSGAGPGPTVWPEGDHGVSGGPPAAVDMKPHQEGSVIREKVWESPVLVSLGELTVLSPSWDSGHKALSVPHDEGFPMWIVGAQEGGVLTICIKQHVFNFHDRTVKTHGRRSPEEERTGVRHGSFSGRVIFSVDSHTAFLKCPSLDSLIVSDSEVSCLTPVHTHSPGAFPQGLSSPLRSRLPMTRWRGPCEEAPVSTILGRASHPWAGDRVSVLLGSRGCLGPIWMRCLLSFNQGKEAVYGPQVLTCTVSVKSAKEANEGKSVLTFYSTFKTKWAPPWKLKFLGMEWNVQKEMSGLGSVSLHRLI